MSGSAPGVERLGDAALLLRFGHGIDAALNRRVQQAARVLRAAPPAWLVDLVPAYATLGVFVDPAALDGTDDPLAAVERWVLQRLSDNTAADDDITPRVVELTVEYGGDAGPDLADVAHHTGLAADEVVRRHTAADYRVAMLGFAPGFPYLLGLDPALATPRLATPRERVPAGSVAIGGAQTGLYPQASPGGWRVIGRTDAVLFDPARDPPTALQPGDRVRFVAKAPR